jgi:hypothetical protein
METTMEFDPKQMAAAVSFLLFCGIGLVGMASHYLKKWLTDEIHGSLFSYLFVQRPKTTGLAIFTMLGTGAGYYLAGSLNTADLPTLIGMAFTAGYASDSVANRGQRPDSGPGSEAASDAAGGT